jgi:acetyl esterase
MVPQTRGGEQVSFDLSRLLDPRAVSDETAAFNARLEAQLAELPRPWTFPPEVVRAARAEGKGALPLLGPREGSRWEETGAATGGGPGRVRISEPEETPRGTFLHIHGGGWVIGAPDQYDEPNQALARRTGLRVVSAQYRLAPEHPWPAARDDCLAAARWALDRFDGRFFIGGESAGGHLAAVTAIGLRDAGLGARVTGVVLNYGVFDMAGTPSCLNWGERYLVLSTPMMRWFFDHVDPDGNARGRPDASPLRADLRDLPPALFSVGTEDPLLDDTLFMAARWQAAGNETRLAVYPGGVHGFDMFDLGIARDFHGEVARFLSSRL